MSRGYQGYFTLIGSLPHLAAPDQAERLPINRQRLEPRFAMLEEQEANDLSLAGSLLLWEHSGSFESESAVVDRYEECLREIRHSGLKAFVEFWMELRTVLAALRRKAKGGKAPAHGEKWGVGPRVGWIERH